MLFHSQAVKAHSRSLIDRAVSVFLPRRCPICDTTLQEEERAWCQRCESGMSVYDRPVCSGCRRFLDLGETQCPTGHEPADPAVLHALGAFDGAFGVMVHALKYDGFRDLANPLGNLLSERVPHGDFDFVVAVPTSLPKKRKRGFGHAEEIAMACAAGAGSIYLPDAIRFTRKVADQTRLNSEARKRNLHGALAVREDARLTDKRVLIIDDVLTTGATMHEAARAVKLAGAASIAGAVVALNLSMQTREF